ncbi:reverse transcriptase domain-containing protein [Tanacetum coccineum]
MSFGLKNTGATYQRLVDKAFDKQVGRNLEVYVDDLVIKSHTEEELLRDIEEMFRTLRKINMKLNPKKCTFRAVEGMFLGELKQHLSELPTLVAPRPQEELIMYLSASHGAVGAVLMTERDTVQTLVYFISRALQGPELNYTPMEKLVLALVFAAKRLRRYFQAHPIAVITDQPIKQIISRPDVAGRLQKWSVMLGEHNITYRPRTSVKGQILADFLVEKPDDAPADTSVKETPKEVWTLFTDGSSCTDGSGAGLILTSPEGTEFTYELRFQFTASNNEAEYEALIAGLLIAAQMGVRHIQENVIREIHEGSCNLHAGPRSVVAKAMRSGYYWPTMHRDARETIRKCKDCQIHRYIPREPQQPLTPITAPWPFYKWGIDIAGPFPEGPGKVKFLMVAMDYFTKWIEAKAVATISGTQVKKFVWNDIVCRFGLPGEIISDNSKQFSSDPFKDWCGKLNIMQRFASVKHPQSNGLVERANRSLGEGIKVRLGENNRNWLEELPHVLWAHRTMIKSSNDDTPFSLTYGMEAVIPAEIGMPTYCTTVVDVAHNDDELRLNLDLVEERRERAVILEAQAKLKMKRYYDARVKNVAFRLGDFVYRSNDASHAVEGRKLGPKWEGPYEVLDALGDGAYKLRSSNGMVLPRTWNVTNLKKCYL